MPIARVQMPDGRIARFEVAEGTPPEQVEAIAMEQFQGGRVVKEKGFGEKLNDVIGDVPRQLGLTARYAVEGLGDTADFVASPARAAMNLLPGVNIEPGIGRNLANDMGLPEPQTPLERGIGGASRMVASGGGSIGLASKAAPLAQGATQEVFKAFAAKPDAQLASLLGGGGAGAYVKETGGGPIAEGIASLAGAVAAPSVYQGAKSATNAIGNLANRGNLTANIDIRIDSALKPLGIKLSDLPMDVRTSMRKDVEKAMKMGELSPDAIRRLADYRSVGANPTRGSLTLDPVDITNERNLAKMGANSSDPRLQTLARNQNTNNATLIGGLNQLGANTTDDAVSAGQKVIGALDARNTQAKGVINTLYDRARNSAGRDVPLDGTAFTKNADDLLKKNLLQGKLDPAVRQHLNDIAEGKVPFTVDYAEQLKTLMGDIARANKGTPEAKAMGLVRQALDDTPSALGLGDDAISAFNRARSVNRAWMNVVDKTPALQAVRDGIEPDKFVQQFIIGSGAKSNLMDVSQLKKVAGKNPEALNAIRGQLLAHLKGKALSGAADEVGNFSQAGYNRALSAIGDRKLSLFFSPEELNQIKAIGRVASYEQFQPRGSAVNNSNTGALVAGLLDRIGNSSVLRKIPFGAELIANPAKNVNLSIQGGKALNVPKGLLQAPVKQPPYRFLAPSAIPGLLAPAE